MRKRKSTHTHTHARAHRPYRHGDTERPTERQMGGGGAIIQEEIGTEARIFLAIMSFSKLMPCSDAQPLMSTDLNSVGNTFDASTLFCYRRQFIQCTAVRYIMP